MNFKFLADSPWKSKREPISNSPSPSPFFRSPYSKAQANSDRFIPCRIHDSASGMLIQSTEEAPQPLPSNTSPNNGQQMIEEPSPLQNRYSALLEAHIISDFDVSNLEPQEKFSASNTPYKTNPNILKYKKLKKSLSENSMNSNGYSPFQTTSFEPPKINVKRQISKLPYKILDVPSLADDFYLNLLDWSSSNNIAVGLGNFVCMWSAATNKAYKIHKAAADYTIASVAWSQSSTSLAVGESDGTIKLYDVETCKLIRDLEGHSCRAGSLAWNGNLLASGSRDRTILVRDVRSSDDYLHKFRGHKQEICGLKWSPDFKYLASGGNDNKIIVWDSKNRNEMVRFSEHQAAVKALAWNPETPHVLASGGGKNDRCIKFWNMHTHKRLGSIDTGSQVCNMVFSKNSNELVSSHGYSLNEVVVWNYPNMEKVASLTGHTSRVLYLCMSPDGENMITGAGDETLRFWNVFPPHSKQNSDIFDHSAVFPSSVDLR